MPSLSGYLSPLADRVLTLSHSSSAPKSATLSEHRLSFISPNRQSFVTESARIFADLNAELKARSCMSVDLMCH